MDPCSDNGDITDGDLTNPIFANADCDGDGVTNEDEINAGTDPLDPCSFDIANQDITIVAEPYLSADCDGDGVTNGDEIIDQTDPNDPCDFEDASVTGEQTGDFLEADCDGDGVTNGDEIDAGTDPFDLCSYDPDPASQDLAIVTEEWLAADCDGDSVPNGQELDEGTDPLDPCDFNVLSVDITLVSDEWLTLDCDGDGILNGDELGDEDDTGIPDFLEVGEIIVDDTPTDPETIQIFNIITPNGDGANDEFRIEGIELFPNNTVRIFNRWGVEVFETQGYDNEANAFRGESNGRVTINQDDQLPAGTYFYVVEYVNNNGDQLQEAGPLYINR